MIGAPTASSAVAVRERRSSWSPRRALSVTIFVLASLIGVFAFVSPFFMATIPQNTIGMGGQMQSPLYLAALLVLSLAAPQQAPSEAWGHAVVVAVFAVLLPARFRSARRGSVGALRAVGIIAAVLFLVNVVEALLPGFVPPWMRVEMVLVAALMLGVIGLVVKERG